MKKWFLLPVAALVMAFTVTNDTSNGGCEGYWLVQKGVTLEYKDYDSKDKLQATRSTSITEIGETNGVMNITAHSVSKDDKDKVTHEGDFKFTCKNGEITIDMRDAMQGQGIQEMEGMEVTIEQTNLVFPSTLTVGQTLPDGSMTIKIGQNGVVMFTTVTKITDRKVEAFESVTTPAGTFECAKMSQVTTTEGMMPMSFKSIDWFTMGYGSVRHESYDKNGKLTSYSVLNSIVK